MLIVGPPGAGKGTQASRITSGYGIPDISTGDIFRANIKNKTELGQQVKAIVDAGDYVPDSLTNELVTGRLAEDDAKGGFLLDGYPRTLEQVKYLDELLGSDGEKLDAVIQLVADREEIVARLTKRAREQGRADDSEEAIRYRQEVYVRETSPLIEVYRERGLLVEVDGLGPVDEVAGRICTALAERGILPLTGTGESVA
ncbi:adenylate kinase [Leifsonia xyli subsp. xyli]|uniref:Adenylate kinase n=3 Tax=Leifsonia xyli TaxID=1575 RepID=KAD_LEIXX|nr:RecName: Full=Adenylate kinase; Short=AK; AltName: Full=ATP-AMP transphosphorylase; AltName: Full=ATP:AMP phosphotransferase; AltName: Full=Adenylate monophosphate kinase [Leifsonia xyli subsp. xyli str. CTCB07]AAT89729.1 adenylate kinase [Leifsonia xyli subsp. xyli str. CTCB07]ODA91170.1 adenylate kinase [Leifsonia xyli subsp. xyli]